MTDKVDLNPPLRRQNLVRFNAGSGLNEIIEDEFEEHGSDGESTTRIDLQQNKDESKLGSSSNENNLGSFLSQKDPVTGENQEKVNHDCDGGDQKKGVGISPATV